ncbi:MAG: hypothetical protein IKK09_02270 [Clostridia bacterium]|nr:hypothetical protein [Clostridia bacterium]
MQFFQKIISLIMSLIMSLLGLAPALQPEDCYTQAEWYAMVVEEFKLDYDKVEGETLTEEQQIIAACKKWNALYGEYDADAAITDVLVAESLVAAANLKAISKEDTAIKIAVDLGVVKIEIEAGKYEAQLISKADAETALELAAQLRSSQVLKPSTNGGTLSTTDQSDVKLNSLSLVPNSDGLTLQTADGEVINEEDITYLSYEGSVNPFVQPEVAGINGQSILEDIEVDFSIGDLDVHAGLADGGFDVSVGGAFKGIYINKSYEVRNFKVDTKFDGALSVNKVKHSYVLVDYDLKDTTTVTGSKSWSLDESELPEGSEAIDFFGRVEGGLFNMKGGSESEIEIFSVDVAIPNCPAITVGITAKFVITFDGRVDLVITSHEQKGVEIIDNKVRAISKETAGTTDFTAQARVEAVLGLYVDISIVSIVLVDVGVEVGLGVHVTVHLTSGAATHNLDIPYDFLMDMNWTLPTGENLDGSINFKVYGIVTISVGENSDILEPLGLCETWRLVTEENGTFIDKTLELSEL